jgi:hypothetical protein
MTSGSSDGVEYTLAAGIVPSLGTIGANHFYLKLKVGIHDAKYLETKKDGFFFKSSTYGR